MDNNESSQEFKIGDVVKLKSGGPTMTVNNIEENGEIYCQWFAGKKLEEGQFSSDSLIRASVNEKEK